jgi:hypothetical protein
MPLDGPNKDTREIILRGPSVDLPGRFRRSVAIANIDRLEFSFCVVVCEFGPVAEPLFPFLGRGCGCRW